IAFSPDETCLVELSASGRLRVWQIAPVPVSDPTSATHSSDAAATAAPLTAPSQLLEISVPSANDAIFAGSSRLLVMEAHAVRIISLDRTGTAASLALRAVPTAFAADAAGDRIAIGDDSGTITLASPGAAAAGQLPSQAALAVCHKRLTAVVFVPHSDRVA